MLNMRSTISDDIDYEDKFFFCQVSTVSPAIRLTMIVLLTNVKTQSPINLCWIIQDTGSTIHIFCNHKLLNKESIHRVVNSTKVHCNTGITVIKHKGLFQSRTYVV